MDAVTVVELVWLAALSWPWTRLVVDRRRRLARTAPLHHAALAHGDRARRRRRDPARGSHAPAVLHVAAAAATLLAAAAWWRARPSYGRSRRLPPGSLAVTRSIEAMVDRDFYAREARRHGPIFKTQFHRPVVCVVGLERGHELMRQHGDSLAPTPLPWNRELRGGFLRYMDDATHEVYSPLFRIALAGRAVAAAEPATRRAARRELEALAAACADSPAAGVKPGDALDRIVLVAFARVLFGIDEESPDFAQARGTKRRSSSADPLDLAHVALEGGARRSSLAGRATAPRAGGRRDNGPVCTLSELGRVAPGMPDDVCVDNLLFILKIPAGDVRSLLRWLVKMLGDHPVWRNRLRADLEAGRTGAPTVADRIVMETLRLEQSEYIHRRVRETFEHDGFVIPAGWLLRLCVRESHRSEEVWRDASTFDPDRFLRRQPMPKSDYSPFGFRERACSGVDLSDMICRVTLEELAAFDWASLPTASSSARSDTGATGGPARGCGSGSGAGLGRGSPERPRSARAHEVQSSGMRVEVALERLEPCASTARRCDPGSAAPRRAFRARAPSGSPVLAARQRAIPASSSTRRCLVTAWRVTVIPEVSAGDRLRSAVAETPPPAASRVSSPSAAKMGADRASACSSDAPITACRSRCVSMFLICSVHPASSPRRPGRAARSESARSRSRSR